MSVSNTTKRVKEIRRKTRRNDWLKKSLTGQGVMLDDD